jgi:prepilin-type N-terminal cleavage/methylation domain-containing protein
MWAKQKQPGFTIVELLIVIVVIGILAAITIVAYNGIQQRARVSSATSALTQVVKKIKVWQVDNPDATPGALSDVGISNGNGVVYGYTPGTSGSYCVTASAGVTSYKVDTSSSSSTAPQQGICSGHTAEGYTTNLSVNPSLEANIVGWGPNWGTSANGTVQRMTDGGQSQTAYYRMSWSATPTVGWGGATAPTVPVSGGKTYKASVWVRISRAQTIYLFMRPNTWSADPDLYGVQTSVPANTWTRLTGTYTTTSGATSFSPKIERTGSGTWQSGDVLDVDALMITEGQGNYSYADGETPGWVWSGAQHNSTSTGPTL